MRQNETEEQFHARVNSELDALTAEYTVWQKANTLAREGYAFFRVETAAVFREYELPTAGKLTGPAKQQYEALKDLAEIHRTGIQSSPYRVG